MIGNTYLELKLLKNPFTNIFCYNNKVNRKVKDFQKLFNKEIYFTLQSNGAKYNKPFKFISWPNFLEGHHILSPIIRSKTFSDWFKENSHE